MLRLHVDRDPLERMHLPQMIKTVDEIKVFNKREVVKIDITKDMSELKDHMLEVLSKGNGVIRIWNNEEN
jgi:hypothetical protein